MPFKFSPGHCGDGDCGCSVPTACTTIECDIPAADLDLTFIRFGVTTSFRLVYSATRYAIPPSPGLPATYLMGHWRSAPIPATASFALGDTVVAWFDCEDDGVTGSQVSYTNFDAGADPYGTANDLIGFGAVGAVPGTASCNPIYLDYFISFAHQILQAV